MKIQSFDQTNYQFDTNLVYIVIEGAVNILFNDTVLDTINIGYHFGDLSQILNVSSIFKYSPVDKCTVYSIPATLIREIPIAFWKILEDYEFLQKKLINFCVYEDNESIFLWHDSYSININEMDKQHQIQLEYLEKINIAIIENKNNQKIFKLLDHLYHFSKVHFQEEELLMIKYNYVNFKNHQNIHNELLKKILVFKDELDKEMLDKRFISVILKEWLLKHIFEEDIKYSRFLNSQGIY